MLHLNPPIFGNNIFWITFGFKKDIRRCAIQIEDILKSYVLPLGGGYNLSTVTPVPDDADPEVPRIVFNSLHGFSQIVFNQIGTTLNVGYSADYAAANAAGKRKDYLLTRIRALHNILMEIECTALISGVVSRVLFFTGDDENKLRGFLPSFISEKYRPGPLYESIFRTVEILDDKFCNIIQISSYREMSAGLNPYSIPRVPARDSVKLGLELIHDINDRYSYNENKNYFTSIEASENMLNRSEGLIQQFLGKF